MLSRNNNLIMVKKMLIFLTSILVIMLDNSAAGKRSFFKMAGRKEMTHIAGYGEEKISTVMVTGSVLCHLHGQPQHHAWPVPGASVGIKCHTKKMKSWTHGFTDDYGDFVLDLPSHLHATPNLDRVCTLQVLGVPNKSLCRPAFAGKHKHSAMKLSSVGNGVRTYSAGTIKFLHLPSEHSQEIIKNTSK